MPDTHKTQTTTTAEEPRQIGDLSVTTPARRSTTRHQRFWVSVIVVLVSIAAGLLCLEVAVRVSMYMQRKPGLKDLERFRSTAKGREALLGDMFTLSENPLLVYRMIPGLDVQFLGKHVRTNAMGFRDGEHAAAKQPGTIRIAALGDSGTFGWRVDEGERYTDALATVLNELSSTATFEVMNFGIPGYNTVMEHELLRSRVLAMQPDAVVLQFELNDMDLPNFMRRRENLLSLSHLYLVDFAAKRHLRLRKSRLQDDPGMGALADVPSTIDDQGRLRYVIDQKNVPPEMRSLSGIDNCTSAIRAIGGICRENHIPAVFVLNPAFVGHYKEGFTARNEGAFAPFVKAAEAAGFTVADPSLRLADFQKRHQLAEEDLWVDPSTYDSHPAPPRHTLIAGAIGKALLSSEALRATAGGNPSDAFSSTIGKIADAQCERMLDEYPRARARARLILPDGAGSQELFGKGWYPPESGGEAKAFRWSEPRAELRIPSAKRVIIECNAFVGHIGPTTQKILLNGKKIPYEVTRRRQRAWIDVAIPPEFQQRSGDLSTLTFKCKPVQKTGAPTGTEGGLQVFSVTIEPI